MITFEHVTYRYPQPAGSRPLAPALNNLSLHIDEGELVLVVGSSGAGKSTFLRCLNGLIAPLLRRQAQRAGAGGRPRSRGMLGPQGMAHTVGMVFQDPETQFVADQVEDELVFGMETQALPPALMRKRVEEVLDQLTIAHLRGRRLSTLSGGEKQRVAIAAVLTMNPELLVLDEPTSQLDPQSAEEVLVAIRRLNEDLGLTVILAEHRLERVVQFVDRVLYLPDVGQPLLDEPRAVMAAIALNPPLVALGKAKGWQPLPLTVKQARRFLPRDRAIAGGGAQRCRRKRHPGDQQRREGRRAGCSRRAAGCRRQRLLQLRRPRGAAQRQPDPAPWRGRGVDGTQRLRQVHPAQAAGRAEQASPRQRVAWRWLARANSTPAAPPLDEIVRVVGYVPQNPGALLFKDTVLEELAFTRQGHKLPPDPAADHALLARLGLAEQAERYPRDLSSGQRQRVALAAILVAEPQVLLLDEPTRGLDYAQKEALTAILLGAAPPGPRRPAGHPRRGAGGPQRRPRRAAGRGRGRGRWLHPPGDDRLPGLRQPDQQTLPRSPLSGGGRRGGEPLTLCVRANS